MILLFASTMGVLLLPKLIGCVAALLSGPVRRGVGGAFALIGSVLIEIVLSALYAPIMMMMQTSQVMEPLLGQDSGWAQQNRNGTHTRPRDARRRPAGHRLHGLASGTGVWFLSPGSRQDVRLVG